MILGHIKNLALEKRFFPANLLTGFHFLQNTDFANCAEGKIEIDGEAIFATVSQYQPEPKNVRRPESHCQYIDIQYIISGEEIIGYTNFSEDFEIEEDLLAQKDLLFYKKISNEIDLRLSEGMYAVFFPWDVHRPCCISVPGISVRKVVVKVKL
jgi:YhcH/YjgK/YiaL family protein